MKIRMPLRRLQNRIFELSREMEVLLGELSRLESSFPLGIFSQEIFKAITVADISLSQARLLLELFISEKAPMNYLELSAVSNNFSEQAFLSFQSLSREDLREVVNSIKTQLDLQEALKEMPNQFTLEEFVKRSRVPRQEADEFLSSEDSVSIQPNLAMLVFTEQQMKLLKQLGRLNDCTRQQRKDSGAELRNKRRTRMMSNSSS